MLSDTFFIFFTGAVLFIGIISGLMIVYIGQRLAKHIRKGTE